MPRSGPITNTPTAVALGLAQIRIGQSAPHIGVTTPVLASSDSIGALASTKFASSVDHWKLESGFPLQEDLTIPIRETASLECGFKEITPKNMALARGLDPLGDISAGANVSSESSVAGTTGTITVVDSIAAPNGPIDETWTIVVESVATDVTYSVYGNAVGQVLSSVTDASLREPDNGGTPYFTIPAGFFGGTWVAGETVSFITNKYQEGTGIYTGQSGIIKLGSLKSPAYLRMEAVYTFPDNIHTMTIIYPRANAVSSLDFDMQAEDAAVVNVSFESKNSSTDADGGNAVWDDQSLGNIIFT